MASGLVPNTLNTLIIGTSIEMKLLKWYQNFRNGGRVKCAS